jgi:hypothetical protein
LTTSELSMAAPPTFKLPMALVLPRMSRLLSGLVVPMPTYPVEGTMTMLVAAMTVPALAVVTTLLA